MNKILAAAVSSTLVFVHDSSSNNIFIWTATVVGITVDEPVEDERETVPVDEDEEEDE